MGQVMGLWPGREKKRLVDALRSKMRLLLPEDPGRERMVELVRLFDPDARPAGAGRISVDGQRRIYLPQPTAVDPGAAAEAHAPPGFPIAYFVQLRGRSAPLDMSGAQREGRDMHQTAVLLVNGLAIRLGGLAWPRPRVASEPLHAAIYVHRPVAATEVSSVVKQYASDLDECQDVTLGSMGVSTWRTADGRLQMEFWPRTSPKAWWYPPESVGEWRFDSSQLDVTVLRLAEPAGQADPAAARTVGQIALAVAAATGGVCVDPLKFRVLKPDDLVMR
jgi:hypothetical protein